MSLKRYTVPVDGTIPVPALLYEDEDLLASQEAVGIYEGMEKSIPHQSGTIHVTTYRLFYIDSSHLRSNSFAMDLSHVARTEHYAGLFTSSPKVTLHLHPLPSQPQKFAQSSANTAGSSATSSLSNGNVFESWECEVCSYRNPPGLSPAASSICGLCGVPRASVKNPVNIALKTSSTSTKSSLSSSLPSSSADLLKFQTSSSSGSPHSTSPPDSEVSGDGIACEACTFLNHPSLPACEICGTPLPRLANPKKNAHHPPAKSAPTSRPPSIDLPDIILGDHDGEDHPDRRLIRLSFRKGGDKNFYAILRRSLLGKAWEANVRKAARAAAAQSQSGPATGRSGINGILRNVETTAASSQTGMEDALKDLEALMVKWKDMVRLAQDLNERLTAASDAAATPFLAPTPTSTDPSSEPGISTDMGTGTGPVMTTQAVVPEEATFIRSSLAQLGLQMENVPVTLDMVRDEHKWIEELARELAGVLQGGVGRGKTEGLMRRRGVIALDEVWGGWNRARGVALIPPSTFLSVVPYLIYHTTPPVHMRIFESSGLMVLHLPPYSRHAFSERMVGLINTAGPMTTIQVAQEEGLPIGLAEEMVREVESEGEICRDESEGGVGLLSTTKGLIGETLFNRAGGEVRWWVNNYRSYEWDGQE